MRVGLLFSWAITAVSVAASVSSGISTDTPSSVRVNGWFPCEFTVPQFDADAALRVAFECAKVQLPLCYDGICKSNRTVDVFVKRLLSSRKDAAKRAVLMVPGGPGASSVSTEQRMVTLSGKLNGEADVYTFDHRGSGRSAFLDCQAARGLDDDRWQASEMTDDQLRQCIKDLAFQYPEQAAAFSATSVAMDIETLVNMLLADHAVFLFSFSYGTYVAQQVMKLQVPQITSYIFDSVDLESPSSAHTDESHWNEAILGPTKRLLQHCFDDASCPLKLKARDSVIEDILALYDSLDGNMDSNACARFLHTLQPTQRPSETLRDLISHDVAAVDARMDAVKTLARLQRCNSDDLSALRAVYDEDDARRMKRSRRKAGGLRKDVDRLESTNMLLHYAIVSSERWNRPSVTKKELQTMYDNGPFSVEIDKYRRSYCIFTGATNDPACADVRSSSQSSTAAPFSYKSPRHEELTLADHASALILAGGLDFATPSEFAELLFGKIQGGKGRMLVTFDYGTHCGGEAAEEDDSMSCYWQIVSQYVKADGDVAAVDTSCMQNLPGLVFPKVQPYWKSSFSSKNNMVIKPRS